MFLIEKRILQDEIYFMNRQVIILCDLKIKISFVIRDIKSALYYWKENCS